jgi:hypothetical protein
MQVDWRYRDYNSSYAVGFPCGFLNLTVVIYCDSFKARRQHKQS